MFSYMYLVYIITLVIVIFTYCYSYSYFSKISAFYFAGKSGKYYIPKIFFFVVIGRKTEYVHFPK